MKILCLCLGNICRSPMAHGILERQTQFAGLDWEVDSAGTSGFHNGETPDPRSIEEARRHGLDISHQRSRLFVSRDLEHFDLILAMDTSNYRDAMRLARNKTEESKIKLILNYVYPMQNRSVPDPYYHDGFDKVYDMLVEAAKEVIAQHR